MKSTNKSKGRSLDGIMVVDLSQGWGGPGGTMLLADQGADVIKVEPLEGDQGRNYFANPPIRGLERGFLAINRSKRSIAVDLKRDRGKEILEQLIRKADVLVHNFREGVPERLGIGYEEVKELNPRIIYVSLGSFGKKGPYAGYRAYDVVIQGLSGAFVRKSPDGTPIVPGIWLSDCSTMMMLAFAVSLALFARERTGLGQQVEMSLLNQALFMQLPDMIRSEEEMGKKLGDVYTENLWRYHTPYRCRDGRYVVPIAMTNEQWKALCNVLELSEMGQDENYNTAFKRFGSGGIIHDKLQECFSERTLEDWSERMKAADVPHAPVLSKDEIFSHPQATENEIFAETCHPIAGVIKMLGVPFKLSETPGFISRPAPQLGEHTKEVLLELGFTEMEVKALEADSVINRKT